MPTAKKSASSTKSSAKSTTRSNRKNSMRSHSASMSSGSGKASARKRSTTARSKASSSPRTAAAARAPKARPSPSAGRSAGRSSGRASATRSKTTRSSSRAQSRSGQVTIDHDQIRQWVESRGGHPATVVGTERDSEAAGLLRIDFPGFSGGQTLAPIDWDEFFEKFEESKLAFLYDTDKESRFSKFVARGKKRF